MLSSDPISAQKTSSIGNSAGRVILVEDNQTLRDSIAEYLCRVGYEVIAVDTGIRFYHALAEQTYNVAIVDLGLPDMDGLQLAEYIRNNTAMHCIILTARDSLEDRVSGYDSGADLYMVKPVDCRELVSALSRMIQRTSQQINKEGPGQWRLNRHNGTLLTPVSALISLTAREMDFLLCLASISSETVPRDIILQTLGYRNDDYSNRALESLIRRLRRKIEHAFGSSPILTRHGVGYSFSAPISMS